MDKQMFGEFMGTLVLILMGNGVVANVNLKKSYAQDAGWMVVATGWALAVMTGVFTAIACGSPGAHLNPAVTMGFAVSSGDFSKLAPYAAAQIMGAIAGATLVWLYFLPHWSVTPEADLKRACFCTSPAIRRPAANLLCEIIGTFVLVLVVSAIFSKAVAAGGARRVWGLILWGAWYGASASAWVEPPVMPSIRRGTWVPGSRTRSCRWPARADRIGAMRRFRWQGR